MENLLEDMKDFYKDPAHPEDLLQPRELVVDLHCAVQRRNDKKWYRATLTGVEEVWYRPSSWIWERQWWPQVDYNVTQSFPLMPFVSYILNPFQP